MKSLNKMMAVFTALATLATASGVGTYSAFAQTVTPGMNTGVRTVQPGGFNGAVGVQAGAGSAQVQLQGPNMRGTVVNVKGGPSVNQRVSAQTVGVLPGTQVQSMASPVIVNPGPANAGVEQDQAMEGPSKTGPPSIIKEVKAQAGVAAMSAPQVPVEQAAYQGKVQFDLAAKKAALNGAIPVSVSGQSTVKPGSVLAKASMEAPNGNPGPLPPVAQRPEIQVGSKLSTFVDALIVTAVGTYTHSYAAAYATLVVISTMRYMPDFIKALSNDSKEAQSGFLRTVTVGAMALVAAPVAFVYESYKNLLVPFVTNVVKVIKNIAIAIKDAAVWVYDNVIVPVAQAIRDFAKAAWEMAKDFARFVKTLIVDFAKAVKQLAIDFYNNIVVPVARFIKQLAIDAYNAVKQLARDFVQFMKDLANAIDQILTDIAQAIKNAATWVYDNVMTPVGHAIRGLSAGAIAGIAAAVVVAGPFLAAVGIGFIVKPIHAILSKMAKWPVAFKIAAAVVAIPLVGTAIAVSYKAIAALAGLTLTGSILVGFGGAALEGIKEGFNNGFVAGIKKGYGDAVKLATGSLESAKTNYTTWKTNLK